MTSQTGVTAQTTAQISLQDGRAASSPRIYLLNPLLAGPIVDWGRWLDRAAMLGFTHVLTAPVFAGPSLLLAEDFSRVHPALGGASSAEDALRCFAEACRARGLTPLLDVYPSQIAAEPGFAWICGASPPPSCRASSGGCAPISKPPSWGGRRA